ncbi:hypothetical protein BGE01nite_05290 [Brevifollis gellanilyticus]|uniref:Glycosyltransferase RgtA/B/C/D-like domain-containing protein n=2 Tax=Brevifollis gellanilyticus TaxID=748831 RepID=A0A512M3G5_9BACT|nr:hypothetical protein BGE01nite_05290 [Brevifollis gellanilyticus]
MRWHGLGAALAVAFYSLFFAAHLRFQETPIYIKDNILFGSSTHTVFNDLTTERLGDHNAISPLHPAFTLLHQPAAQMIISGWQVLGQNLPAAQKHGVAALTCVAAALTVVMVYHTLLWCGATTLRSTFLAMIFGASTCAWIMAPLPETWIFAGLGVAALIAVTARGALAHPAWHLVASVYAMSTFLGNVIPCLIMAMTRCAQDRKQMGSFHARPILILIGAFTITFGLANLQRVVYPTSAPLPKTSADWLALRSDWKATRDTQALVAREVFVSNIVAPSYAEIKLDNSRSKVVLNEPFWSVLGLRRGLSGGWLLILALAFAGLVWRAQIEPFTLGVIGVLVWSIATVGWYGRQDHLLLYACLWTAVVVIATGLGLERALQHWKKLIVPVTLFLGIFIIALLTRNWLFILDVAEIPRS